MGAETAGPQSYDDLDPQQPPRVGSNVTPAIIQNIRRILNMLPTDHMDFAQYEVIHEVMTKASPPLPGQPRVPLRIVLLGAPGTGKTYTMMKAEQAVGRYPFLMTAPTGSAAGNLHGKTTHNTFGMNPMSRDNNPGSTRPLTVLGANNLPTRLAELTHNFVVEDRVVVIDEISLLGALQFAHINNRCQEIGSDISMRQSIMGGWHMILAGDWFQIDAVGTTLPKFIYKWLIKPDSIKSPQDDLLVQAAEAFVQFRRLKLIQQNRARGDVEHTQRIETMANYATAHPVTPAIVNYLKSIPLVADDILHPSGGWVKTSTILTPINTERCHFNNYLASLFAVVEKKVCIKWALKMNAGPLVSDADMRELCDKYAELNGIFVQGAPCTFTQNISPEKGLSNGGQAHMHSLIFDEHHAQYQETMRIINAAPPGSTVFVPLAPSYILVELTPHPQVHLSDREKIPAHVAVPQPGRVLVPVNLKTSQPKKETVSVATVQGRLFRDLTYEVSVVELLFACTFDKCQGKTLNKVVLCLHKNDTTKSANLEHLHVAFSRVTTGVVLTTNS